MFATVRCVTAQAYEALGLELLVGEIGSSRRHTSGSRQRGKRRGSQRRGRSRASRLFCVIARSVGRSVDKALGGFYCRLKGRRGGLVTNLALARKLAELFLVFEGSRDQLC